MSQHDSDDAGKPAKGNFGPVSLAATYPMSCPFGNEKAGKKKVVQTRRVPVLRGNPCQ